jgi:predicted Fe-Mo cluster-binding NifX family protein
MKICIPIDKNEGLDSTVCGHFGSAPFFAVCDTETKNIEIITNTNEHGEHGQCNPLGAIGGKNIQVLLLAGIGRRAIEKLNAVAIKVYCSTETTVKSSIEKFNKGELKEISIDNACSGHDCH